jgi:hypothetical protein
MIANRIIIKLSLVKNNLPTKNVLVAKLLKKWFSLLAEIKMNNFLLINF